MFGVYFGANYKPHFSHFWENDFLTLKVLKMCYPIPVTLLKVLESAIIVSRKCDPIQGHIPSSPLLGSIPSPQGFIMHLFFGIHFWSLI